MLTILICSVIFTVAASFFCSLCEAALYAVPIGYVEHTAETSRTRSAKILLSLKNDISRPIAAILILNTISNTAGAAVAGAQADAIWGSTALVIFSVLFTLTILFVSEIIPKVLGVIYAKQVALSVALPLKALITLLLPVVKLTTLLSDRLQPEIDAPSVSEDEVRSMAAIGTREGTLDSFEESVISNVMGLDTTLVRDIVTPRKELVKLSSDIQFSEVRKKLNDWRFSRVPLHEPESPDHLTHYIIQRDIYRALLNSQIETGDGHGIRELARPLLVVPELMTVDRLLAQMFEKGEHIVSVVDEHGALAGIVTLEDILEEIVGREIVDEYDRN